MLTIFFIKHDDILKFHGQELIYHNSMELTKIARAESDETKVVVSLADQTSQDSRIMRIVTIIAMLYLPANLVMVCLHYQSKISFIVQE